MSERAAGGRDTPAFVARSEWADACGAGERPAGLCAACGRPGGRAGAVVGVQARLRQALRARRRRRFGQGRQAEAGWAAWGQGRLTGNFI